jgi:hypothetical protein
MGVAALGVVVALVVAASATAAAIGGCRSDLDGQCRALMRSLSLRMGLVAGVAAVVMLLVVVGLLRMVAQDEDRRAETRPAPRE